MIFLFSFDFLFVLSHIRKSWFGRVLFILAQRLSWVLDISALLCHYGTPLNCFILLLQTQVCSCTKNQNTCLSHCSPNLHGNLPVTPCYMSKKGEVGSSHTSTTFFEEHTCPAACWRVPSSPDAELPHGIDGNKQRAGKEVRWSRAYRPSAWTELGWMGLGFASHCHSYFAWLIQKCISRLHICQWFKNKIAIKGEGKPKAWETFDVLIPYCWETISQSEQKLWEAI